MTDKMQADACVAVAKQYLYKRFGVARPYPKTTFARDEARDYIKTMKAKNNTSKKV